MDGTQTATRFHLDRRSASYWRVTFDNPPLNIFGPENMPELNAVVAKGGTRIIGSPPRSEPQYLPA